MIVVAKAPQVKGALKGRVTSGAVSGECRDGGMSEMNATATDFGWFAGEFEFLAQAYCITLVRGLSSDDVLARLGAQTEIRVTGVESLYEPAYDAWSDHGGNQSFVGVAALGEWALMVEPNGFLGVTDRAIAPLSRGTRAVSHSRRPGRRRSRWPHASPGCG